MWNADRTYDTLLNLLYESAVTWEPYTDMILWNLPPICTISSQIWRGVMPIICLKIVDMHVSDRALRQFGFTQYIPDTVPDCLVQTAVKSFCMI